jgi:hypothetical protein
MSLVLVRFSGDRSVYLQYQVIYDIDLIRTIFISLFRQIHGIYLG